MPTGYTDLENEGVDIDNILSLRRKFDVSTEAILIRMAKLTSHACAVIAAARIGENGGITSFRIDYSIPSRASNINIPANFRIESSKVLSECTAIGFTAKGTESWGGQLPAFDVQCVGIPPFPGDRFPRIAGVVTSEHVLQSSGLQIEYLFGDAMEPRGKWQTRDRACRQRWNRQVGSGLRIAGREEMEFHTRGISRISQS